MRFLSVILVVVMVMATGVDARRHKHRDQPQSREGGFDLFVLALSWAPQFCAHATHPSASECGPEKHLGFIVHGFWPENRDGKWPEFCQSSPVASSTVEKALAFIPDRGLIQHEWQRHGSCSGMTADDYFATIGRLRQNLRLPDSLLAKGEVAPAELERSIASLNGAPRSAVHASCREGELMAVNVCYSKELQPVDCPASIRSCQEDSVKVLTSR